MNNEDTPPIEDMADEWADTTENQSARERIYVVTTSLTDPTSVATIAERTGCSPNTARDTLSWFREMGIVRQVAENPALYRRNDAYFEFLRVDRLANKYSTSELDALSTDLRERESELAAEFEVDHPDDVTLDSSDPETLEHRYDLLSEWQTVRRRIRDVLQAKANHGNRVSDQNDSLLA